MEENKKTEDVIVEVEVKEEKKKFWTKKKMIAIGGVLATVVVAGVALALKGKSDSEGGTILETLQEPTDYEPVVSNSEVDEL